MVHSLFTQSRYCTSLKIIAGIPISKVSGTPTSVYESSMADDYSQILSMDPDESPRNAVTGTACAMLVNRVSWYFNLQDPSLHIDTACSGSMVALDLASTSLRSGESSMVSSCIKCNGCQ
jgi:acyl transferase domain-containing protein